MQTRSRAEERTPEADAEFGRAKNRGAGADGERDAGAFAEIAGRETLRPHPVMRFVEGEIGRAEKRQPNRRQAENEEPNRSRVAH